MREHGTRARYVHGPDEQGYDKPCRCAACTEANRAWTNDWEAARRRGESSFVDDERAQRVRRHVETLLESGLGTRRICEVAGVSRSSLQQMLAGRDRIRHVTADRLMLLVPAVGLANHAVVDAAETWERIQALRDAGYTKVWIAEQIGQSRALQLGRDQVTAVNARRVEAVWKRFIGLAPPRRGTRHCCYAERGVACRWTARSGWFCELCGYGRHACP